MPERKQFFRQLETICVFKGHCRDLSPEGIKIQEIHRPKRYERKYSYEQYFEKSYFKTDRHHSKTDGNRSDSDADEKKLQYHKSRATGAGGYRLRHRRQIRQNSRSLPGKCGSHGKSPHGTCQSYGGIIAAGTDRRRAFV